MSTVKRRRRRIGRTLPLVFLASAILILAGVVAFRGEEAGASCGPTVVEAVAPVKAIVESKDPLRRLLDGNERFVASRMAYPDQSPEHRAKISQAQEPFAVVLCCSDSRVPPEIIFDQGLGDLFIVRVAGNSVEPATLGSIEYAAEHLKTSLVVVLGHERCGAVKAAVAPGEAPGHLGAILDPIRPSVEAVKAKGGDVAENAMKAHVRNMVGQLKSSKPVLAELSHEGRLKVVGARYDLDTGRVEILE